ncbi:DNA cytosine methyltransferase [Clostridium perfringens]
MYSILDLFAGCGGLALGFKENGNFEIKLANDIWEPAMQTYCFNNKEVEFILGDIKDLDECILNKKFKTGVDVIIGGPPCQGFSMCGTRDINDNRNTLFYEYARIVKLTRPYIFVMENVKGLLSMKNKENKLVIEAIYDEFKKLGYNIKHKVLNAKYYGVPQARERVIIVGTREDLPNNYEYPDKVLNDDNIYTVKDALESLPNIDSENGELEIDSRNLCSNYIKKVSGNLKIYNHKVPSHKDEVVHRMSLVPQGGNWKDIPEEFRAGGIHSNAYRRLKEDEPSVTIKHAYKSMIIHPLYNRCLSIREVARLQSFSDSYIFKDSRSSQYQQLANAVPPLLSKVLAESVEYYLKKNNIVKKNNFYDNINLNCEQLAFF